MHSKIHPVLFLIGVVLSEAFAQSSVKRFHRNHFTVDFLLAILGYTLVCYFLYKSYKFAKMGIVNAIWSALSVLTISLIGCFLFDEIYSTKELVGMGMIISGLIIINI